MYQNQVHPVGIIYKAPARFKTFTNIYINISKKTQLKDTIKVYKFMYRRGKNDNALQITFTPYN